MLEIQNIKCDGRPEPFGLGSALPAFSWQLASEQMNTLQAGYRIVVSRDGETAWDSGEVQSEQSIHLPYGGEPLLPHSLYTLRVEATDNHGQQAAAESRFYTGKLEEAWQGRWIATGNKNDKENTLPVEIFRREVEITKPLARAVLYASALGIYEASVNGGKAGQHYFTPGYTSYPSYVQFQTYDISPLLNEGANTVQFELANGWYCGTIIGKNNFYGDERALIAEIHLFYEDGGHEVIPSGGDWQWTTDGPIRYADFYNGEVVDTSRADPARWQWRPAGLFGGKAPALAPHFGAFVKVWQELTPTGRHTDPSGYAVFDMGQNFSGIVRLTANVKKGDVVTVRHAEILDNGGAIYTENLRSAKAQSVYHCHEDGQVTFTPKFTFMGFRYVEVSGVSPGDVLSLTGLVLSSDTGRIGSFTCSDPLVNRLQENIFWGQLSNFVEIPTDCPQRNERLGWTGDIAVFASTAAYNADISLFIGKWLRDLRTEQAKNGLIPFTVPDAHAFTPFKMATAGWGDAAVLVPWAAWLAYGDRAALGAQYPSMKAWLKAEGRAASFMSLGHHRYIWSFGWQFGDWCAPGEKLMQWWAKGKWLATAYYANSARIMSRAATVLGEAEDAKAYAELYKTIRTAFLRAFLKTDGTLTGDFQSDYVCALVFDLLPEKVRPIAAGRLKALIDENGGCLATGFLGTPYITFALSDAGLVREAYSLLLNEKAPGWLYTVKAGGTTIWERWDALDEHGNIRTDLGVSDMVSFNHYAYGAVGDWLYRRVCGLEGDWQKPGYKHFFVKPLPDARFTYAETGHHSPYGEITVRWELSGSLFSLAVKVPANTTATVTLPDGQVHEAGSGSHRWEVPWQA